jgi:pimeloyl-ACP methyl ester carboxylesterase
MSILRCGLRGAALLGIATLARVAAAQGVTQTPAMVTNMALIQPARLVDIGRGRRMNIYCIGHGSPIVIFEAGLGDQIRAWAMVQPAIAKVTRACSYDRAGLGFSDSSGRPGTAENAVDDLHRLLAAASVKPPYVLVGHSLGGLYMQLFADRYRSEVAGMVLVDPVSFDQGNRYNALDPAMTVENRKFVRFLHDQCIPAARKGYVGEASLFKKCVGEADPHFSAAFNHGFLANHSTPKYMQAAWSEWANVFTVSSDEVRAAKRSYGGMPLVVLSRAPFPRQPHETQMMRDAKNYLWVEMHDDIAALSTRGVNEIVPGAGHYIQFDKPGAAIDAIQQVIDTVRADGHDSTAAHAPGGNGNLVDLTPGRR